MPLKLEIKRKLVQRSERVKSVDLHPTKPWILASLYSGTICIWNYQSQLVGLDEFDQESVTVPKLVNNYLQALKASEESLGDQLEKAKKKEVAFIGTYDKHEQEIAELKEESVLIWFSGKEDDAHFQGKEVAFVPHVNPIAIRSCQLAEEIRQNV